METQLQKSLDEPDELLEAQAEVRHLRETTLILREELEAQRYEKDAAVQKAIQRSALMSSTSRATPPLPHLKARVRRSACTTTARKMRLSSSAADALPGFSCKARAT